MRLACEYGRAQGLSFNRSAFRHSGILSFASSLRFRPGHVRARARTGRGHGYGGGFEAPAEALIYNLTDSTLHLRWHRVAVGVPPGMETAVADCNLSYPPFVSTRPFDLLPGDTCPLNVYFLGEDLLDQSAEVRLQVVDLAHPADTVTGIYRLNPTSAADEAPGATRAVLFPNPAGDYFYIAHAEAAATIRVLTPEGREAARFQAAPGRRYPLSRQPAGIYVVALEDETGRVIQVMELRKQ